MAEKDDKMARNKKSREGLTLEEKEALVRDLIGIDKNGKPVYGIDKDGKPAPKYEGLKINREHLRALLDKYGGYSYDIMQFANLNPKRLMDSALKGREVLLSEHPIVQEFMANRSSMTSDKAIEFFAEMPTNDLMLADVYEGAGKERVAREMRAAVYLAEHGAKKDGKVEATQRQFEGRMGAKADAKAKQNAAKSNTGQTNSGGRED